MYYAFNSFTGRLISASHAKSFSPQGLQILARAAAPSVVKAVPLARDLQSSVGAPSSAAAPKSAVDDRPTVSEKMKRLQAHFQKDDGLPVYLKGGPLDKVAYYTTVGLCTVGLIGLTYEIYQAAW